MRNVIEAAGLRCRYGDFEAVRGVDLQVGEGELFALLGTNGAGKTTTLEALEGLRAPSAGTVRVLGFDPHADRAAVRARTGVVLQESGFPADLTPREMLRLWRRDANADEALERLDLAHRRDVRLKQLSGGERRRLDLALALVGRPEVLFLDEPTTGLDPESRKRTWEVVREVLAEGTTVLLTTHYLEEAESLAHRLAILHRGEVAVSGPLVDVLAAQPARIGFDMPDRLDATALPILGGDVVHSPSGRVDVRTRDLQHDLSALLHWAHRDGLRLHRLSASHASLEDVFHRAKESS
ncbi:ABC transporter ATP-binding protein [Actinosynnema sp. NPDC020468]|uniref:ABC transporter ATP-binding protein n=1 Tax=Actinosynnema sp. NPDC020468 TaxID=3154488 RepID=UPI00340C10F8